MLEIRVKNWIFIFAIVVLFLGCSSGSAKRKVKKPEPPIFNISSIDFDADMIAAGQSGLMASMMIENAGLADALLTDYGLQILDENGNDVSEFFDVVPVACEGEEAPPEEIGAGEEQEICFELAVHDDAPPDMGAVMIAGAVAGASADGLATMDKYADDLDETTVLNACAPSITTLSAVPDIVNQGDTGLVVGFIAKNLGESSCELTSVSLILTDNYISACLPSATTGAFLTAEYTSTTINVASIAEAGKILDENEEATYSFSLDISDTATSGQIYLCGVVNATDSHSDDEKIETSTDAYDYWRVARASALVINSITPAQAKVSKGQSITVEMVAENTGEIDADINDLDLLTENITLSESAAGYITITPIAAQNPTSLAGETEDTFYFTLTVASDANSGVVDIDGYIAGVDTNTAAAISTTSDASVAGSIEIQSIADISHTFAFASNPAVENTDDFTVTVTVTNNGEATANSVTVPAQLTMAGCGDTTFVSSPSTTTFNLAGGASQNSVYTYDLEYGDAGALTFSLTSANYVDANSGEQYTETTTSDTLNVRLPAPTITVTEGDEAEDNIISGGETITVTLTVTNDSATQLDDVTPSITLSGTGSATLNSGPIPVTADIAASGSQVFTYTYTTTDDDAGTVIFTGSVASTTRADTECTFGSASVASDELTIKSACNLSITSVTIDADTVTVSGGNNYASRGQENISVALVATNTGETDCETTNANLVFDDADETENYTISATTATTISEDEEVTFSYTVEVEATATPGSITVDGSISGTDANSGDAITDTSASTTDTIIIQKPATLTITSIATTPETVTRDQTSLTVTITIQNGDANTAPANNVSGDLIFCTEDGTDGDANCGGAGDTNKTTDYSFAEADIISSINGGSTGTLTFTVTVTTGATLGVITLDGANASGEDNNISGLLSTDNYADTVDTWTVKEKAILAIDSITANPDTVTKGQSGITVTMVVGNTGGVNATIPEAGDYVVNLTLNLGGTDKTSQYTLTPALSPATILAEDTATYTWNVTVAADATEGEITVDGNILARDATRGADVTVSSAGDNTDILTVQAPASVVIENVAVTNTTVTKGQTGIAITFDVRNTETYNATASVSAASLTFTVGGSDKTSNYDQTLSSPDLSANIAGGATQTFTYSVDVHNNDATDATPGVATISATITADDINTDAANDATVTGPSADEKDSFTVQTPPSLSIGAIAAPANVSIGQTATVTVQVTNGDSDSAAATNVTGALVLCIDAGDSDCGGGGETAESGNYTGDDAPTATIDSLAGGATDTLSFSVTVGADATVSAGETPESTTVITIDIGSVSGADENTSDAVSTSDPTDNSVDTWEVWKTSSLAITAVTDSVGGTADIYQGEPRTITVSVKNGSDSSFATANIDDVEEISGGVVRLNSSDDNDDYTIEATTTFTTIAANVTKDFEFSVTPKFHYDEGASYTTATVKDNVTIDAYISGTDDNSEAATTDDGADTADAWDVVALFQDSGESLGSSSARMGIWGDYDADGDADIIVTNFGAGGKAYINGGGSFSDDTANIGDLSGLSNNLAASFGDMNSDGLLDLALTTSGSAIEVYQNYDSTTKGKFADVTDDVDLDQSADGIFAYAWQIMWFDYDNDADLDLYVPDLIWGGNFLFEYASSAFTDQTSTVSLTNNSKWAAIGDYNNDGNMDIYFSSSVAKLFEGDGSSFSAASAGLSDTGLTGVPAFADYDNDGDQDLFAPTNGADKLYKNSSGTYSTVSAANGSNKGMIGVWGDYDNDGDLDLFVANGETSAQNNYFYINNGSDSFSEIATTVGFNGGTTKTTWASSGDYDDDGDLDILIINFNAAATLYENYADKIANNWVKVKALGATGGVTSSNAPVIGAKIEVDADQDGTYDYTRYVESYTGSDHTAHFGLGANSPVNIKVTYPGGGNKVQTGVGTGNTCTFKKNSPITAACE